MARKNKETLITSFVVVGIMSFIIGFMMFVIHDNEEKKVEQAINNGMLFKFIHDGNETVEYGDDIVAEDFIKDYDGDLTLPSLNTKKVGIQTLTYVLEYGDLTSDYKKTIIVQDTKKPIIKPKKGTVFTIHVGEELPFTIDDFEAKDPVDGKLKITMKNSVDTHKPGMYTVKLRTEDKNKNQTTLQVTVKVKEKKKKNAMDYSLGTELDAYQQIDENSISVRDCTVTVESDISKKVVKEYVKQFNLCPQFLLSSVDTFKIVRDESINKLVNNREDIIGHFRYDEKKSTVYLSETVQDDVLMHECAHAFGQKYNVIKDTKFLVVYKEEREHFKKEAAKNPSEFFAYTFTSYLTDGFDALAEKCPKTANYFKEMSL